MNDNAGDGRRFSWGTSGLVMGRPLGIPVYVSPTWFVVAAVITVLFARNVQYLLPEIGLWRYPVAFTFAVLLYLSVFVHELSHSVVARAFGLRVRGITLHLLGGVSEIEAEPQTPWREFLVAFAGPVLSLLLALGGYGLYQILPNPSVASLLAFALALANLVVGVFNLLPGLPLDGGRMLRAGLWKLTGRPVTATIAAAWVGRVLGVAVFLAPFVTAALQVRSPDIYGVIWAALIGSFIWVGAGHALRTARVRDRLPGLAARDLARQAVPVPADVPLAEALRRTSDGHAAGLVVVDPAGRPIALVNQTAVLATPEHRRPWVNVGTMSRTIEPGQLLAADLTGGDLVGAMQAAPSREYLLLERDGRMYGVLAAADVERAFARV